MPTMTGFRVGLGNQILNSRYSPTALPRADYLTAAAAGLDAYWVADHLNALFPRSIYTPQYVGAARVAPKIDAMLEPWTLLGHLASRNRFARVRLGVGVTRSFLSPVALSVVIREVSQDAVTRGTRSDDGGPRW